MAAVPALKTGRDKPLAAVVSWGAFRTRSNHRKMKKTGIVSSGLIREDLAPNLHCRQLPPFGAQ
jgi:hypothetical protein